MSIDLLTGRETARVLKICRKTLFNLRVAGRIGFSGVGSALRFRAADVLAYAAIEGGDYAKAVRRRLMALAEQSAPAAV